MRAIEVLLACLVIALFGPPNARPTQRQIMANSRAISARLTPARIAKLRHDLYDLLP